VDVSNQREDYIKRREARKAALKAAESPVKEAPKESAKAPASSESKKEIQIGKKEDAKHIEAKPAQESKKHIEAKPAQEPKKSIDAKPAHEPKKDAEVKKSPITLPKLTLTPQGSAADLGLGAAPPVDLPSELDDDAPLDELPDELPPDDLVIVGSPRYGSHHPVSLASFRPR